jgi:MFS family permease
MSEQMAASMRPSRGRWYVLLMISAMYLITYLDRVNISTAAPLIRQEFGFDSITLGFIFSAFVWAYAAFQVPGGWLSDKLGARGVLASIVAYWSIMTAVTAGAFNAASFIVVRFLFGVGEAGAFPGATRAMQLWYPQPERGFVQGITHSASRLGAAIAPPLVVLIMSQFGWRAVFLICGAVGFLWSLWWGLSYRNLPEEHRLVNRAELERIRGLDATGAIKPPPMEKQANVPWGTLLRSPNMWAIMAAYFTYVYCLWIFLSWLPSYLRRYGRRLGDRLSFEAHRQRQDRPARRGDHRPSRLRRVYRAGGADRGRLHCGILPDRFDVLFGMHHWTVLGGADGHRRQIFRHRLRHDEHGRQYRRRAFADRVRLLGAGRQLAGAIHRRSRSLGRRRGGVGVLARSRQAYFAGVRRNVARIERNEIRRVFNCAASCPALGSGLRPAQV